MQMSIEAGVKFVKIQCVITCNRFAIGFNSDPKTICEQMMMQATKKISVEAGVNCVHDQMVHHRRSLCELREDPVCHEI